MLNVIHVDKSNNIHVFISMEIANDSIKLIMTLLIILIKIDIIITSMMMTIIISIQE